MANTSRPEPKDHEASTGGQPDLRLYTSFDDMLLHPLLLRGILSYGFAKPSAIQQRAIVPMIQGGDIIAQAQSGTGKTGAFSIALLQRIDFRHKNLQALILSPTRELAQQTHQVVSQIGEYLSESTPFCHTFVGGTRVHEDLKKAEAGVLVAVGTPGRVGDILKRSALRTDSLRVLVLDEADEMAHGFSEEMDDIFKFLPKDIQVALFSTTMPDALLELTKKFLRNPTRILVKKESLTLEGIKQFYVAVEEDQKCDTLMDLYESVSIAQSVIFANTRRKVDWLYERLKANNQPVSFMHGDMTPGDRERVLGTFRSGSSRVLVATDLVTRGIDLQNGSIVINYDLPSKLEDYRRRIDRGSRYGRKGVAINFVSKKDMEFLRQIEANFETKIDELPMDFAAYLGE
jgi:translation initiation factor 4A